jgi:hypothetical protein
MRRMLRYDNVTPSPLLLLNGAQGSGMRVTLSYLAYAMSMGLGNNQPHTQS